MDQTGLPSNSLMNQKEVEPNIDDLKVVPVVTGEVVEKKKSLGKRFVETFISEDITDIPRYLKTEVFVPLVKKVFLDSLNILLNGRSQNYVGGSEIRRYDRLSTMGSGMKGTYILGPSTSRSTEASKRTFNDLYYKNGADGKLVKENIEAIFNQYRIVRVADLLEASNLSNAIDFTDYNYGWTDIRAMQLIYDGKGGSTLKMPPPHPLDR